jgi:hypothetical protein
VQVIIFLTKEDVEAYLTPLVRDAANRVFPWRRKVTHFELTGQGVRITVEVLDGAEDTSGGEHGLADPVDEEAGR